MKNENTEIKTPNKTDYSGIGYKDFTLKSMIEFVFMLRNRTTSELVKDFPRNFQKPSWDGNQSEAVKKMLAIDAIQWKLTGQYAKFLINKLDKKQFDQTDEENCLFKGDWKHKICNITGFDIVYNEEIRINLHTLDGVQFSEGGCLEFQLIGNTIGQMADVIKDIKLTDLAIKCIFI
ncbi:MAG: hypothetical protein PHT69_02690 [Bacteroidales bacterium]|nr:hypothetical protein [Bacteroidales bacterium]